MELDSFRLRRVDGGALVREYEGKIVSGIADDIWKARYFRSWLSCYIIGVVVDRWDSSADFLVDVSLCGKETIFINNYSTRNCALN